MSEQCVIFTKNRSSIVKRTIDLYSRYFTNIVVLDGSDSDHEIKLSDELLEKCKYFLLPGSSVLKRLKLAATLIDSDVIYLCPDDDIMIPSRLKEASTLLSSKCKMVYGDQAGVSLSPNNNIIYHPLWIWSARFDINSIERKIERLVSTYSHIQSARFYWGVYDCNYLKSLIGFISCNSQYIWQFEAAFTFFNISNGYPRYYRNIMMIRNTLRDAVDKNRGKLKFQGDEKMKEAYLKNKKKAIGVFIDKCKSSFDCMANDAEWNILKEVVNISHSENNNSEILPLILPDICLGSIQASNTISNMRKFDDATSDNTHLDASLEQDIHDFFSQLFTLT